MVRSALALVLIAQLARADDTPRMRQIPVAQTEMVSHPNWVLTPEGKERLQATIDRQVAELEGLRMRSSSLEADLKTMESKPALTPLGVAVLIGIGVVIGASAASAASAAGAAVALAR